MPIEWPTLPRFDCVVCGKSAYSPILSVNADTPVRRPCARSPTRAKPRSPNDSAAGVLSFESLLCGACSVCTPFKDFRDVIQRTSPSAEAPYFIREMARSLANRRTTMKKLLGIRCLAHGHNCRGFLLHSECLHRYLRRIFMQPVE
jgi:hypothetical protein